MSQSGGMLTHPPTHIHTPCANLFRCGGHLPIDNTLGQPQEAGAAAAAAAGYAEVVKKWNSRVVRDTRAVGD